MRRMNRFVALLCLMIAPAAFGQTFHSKQAVVQARTSAGKGAPPSADELKKLGQSIRQTLQSQGIAPGSAPAPAAALPPWTGVGPELRVMNSAESRVYRSGDRGVVSVEFPAGKDSLAVPAHGETLIDFTRRYVGSRADLFRLKDPASELVLKKSQIDSLGIQHLQYEQRHKGIPIWGRNLTAHFNSSGSLRSINCLLDPTPGANLPVTPTISADQAIEIAKQKLIQDGLWNPVSPETGAALNYGAPGGTLYYWQTSPQAALNLSWVVEIRPNLIDFYRFFISSIDGTILESYNATVADGPFTAQATNLLGQTKTVNTYQIGATFFMLDASRPMFVAGQTGTDLQNNPKGVIATWDLRNTDPGQNAMIFDVTSANNTWSDPTSVSAQDFGGIAFEYYRTTHNRNSIDGMGGSIISLIHVTQGGQGMDNAFWNGKVMLYGDGHTFFKPLARGLDVAGHEMTHGVTQNTANLEYKNQSGALNESMSDVFGIMVDRANFQIGEDVIQDLTSFPTGSLRSMQDPHNGGAGPNAPSWQPAVMAEFQMLSLNQDNGGVHVNSGIPNHACFFVIQSIGREKTEQIYYRALTMYLQPQSNFVDARIAFARAAGDLFGDVSAEQTAVKTAFDNVGILEGSATPPPPTDPTVTGTQAVVLVGTDNMLYGTTPAFDSFFPLSPFLMTQVNVNSGRPIAVDTYGQIILFTDSSFTLRDYIPSTQMENIVDNTLEFGYSSVAISPRATKVAITRSIEEKFIYVVDIVAGTATPITLLHPTSAQGVFQDNVRFADSLVFVDEQFLIYDSLNRQDTPGATNQDYWDVNVVDVTNGQIFPLFPPQDPGINIGNPILATRNRNILAVEIFDTNTNSDSVLGENLFSGEANVIFTNGSDIALADYSVDDSAMVFVHSNSMQEPDVFQIPIDATGIAASGPAVDKVTGASFPIWFVIGTPPTPTPTATPTPTPTATPTPTPTPLPPGDTLTLDYTQGGSNAQGWLGGAVQGFGGTTALSASGLCMTVPGPGDNFVLWVSPERLVEITDGVLYRVRLTLSTTQAAQDAIPLFFLVYDNFITGGAGNNYGGFFWVLDVDGGAEGIGRAGGRTTYDFYICPNAINTPQWINQAFLPAADAENDIRLQFRIIDSNATLLTDNDSGTICVASAEIKAISRSNVGLDQTVFNPPISSATHFAQANNEIGLGGTATIDNVAHTVRYQISTTGDNRKTLGPFDPTAGADLNSQLYPVLWEGNRLFRIRVGIGAEASIADPIDAIFVAADTTTQELGMTHFTTRGAPGGPMDKAASPKLASAEYEAYFFSQNPTASLTPNAGRLRPLAFFFNATDQGGGDGTGGDPFIVNSLAVDRMVTPP